MCALNTACHRDGAVLTIARRFPDFSNLICSSLLFANRFRLRGTLHRWCLSDYLLH